MSCFISHIYTSILPTNGKKVVFYICLMKTAFGGLSIFMILGLMFKKKRKDKKSAECFGCQALQITAQKHKLITKIQLHALKPDHILC